MADRSAGLTKKSGMCVRSANKAFMKSVKQGKKLKTVSESSPSSTTTGTRTWSQLPFWSSADWLKVQAKIRHDDVRPEPNLIFRPLILTPLRKVKVVIIGQEPACVLNGTDGLAFSHGLPIKYPEDLPRVPHAIDMEVERDLGCKPAKTGSLRRWAEQGVLLWNSSPTVRYGLPYSHMNIGWESLTSDIIDAVYETNPKAVFVFWNTRGPDYSGLLPSDAYVLKTPSPAPYDNSPFYGSRPFSKINKFLDLTGQRRIDWSMKP
jgi:uracil-DNA glycosylase